MTKRMREKLTILGITIGLYTTNVNICFAHAYNGLENTFKFCGGYPHPKIEVESVGLTDMKY